MITTHQRVSVATDRQGEHDCFSTDDGLNLFN